VSNCVSSLNPSAVAGATDTNCAWLLSASCNFVASTENKYELCGGFCSVKFHPHVSDRMKRRLEDEGHVFQEKWGGLYFFSAVREKIVLVI